MRLPDSEPAALLAARVAATDNLNHILTNQIL